eukprot:Sspe_Gene.110337::Locus_90942_Transcript_1_1_Confidence_1.000_Length_834::g.110337::m.110337
MAVEVAVPPLPDCPTLHLGCSAAGGMPESPRAASPTSPKPRKANTATFKSPKRPPTTPRRTPPLGSPRKVASPLSPRPKKESEPTPITSQTTVVVAALAAVGGTVLNPPPPALSTDWRKTRALFPPTLDKDAVTVALQQARDLLSMFTYNLNGSTYNVDKKRPLKQLLATGDTILKEGSKIQCVEASFVALQLTQHLTPVLRFGMSFDSKSEGRGYRHLVMGIKHHDLFGALGISRNPGLMSKDIRFRSLADLVK